MHQILEIDTPIFVVSQKQYGVVRKVLKGDSKEEVKEVKPAAGKEGAAVQDLSNISYEVRLSTTLENIIVEASDLKRTVTV